MCDGWHLAEAGDHDKRGSASPCAPWRLDQVVIWADNRWLQRIHDDVQVVQCSDECCANSNLVSKYCKHTNPRLASTMRVLHLQHHIGAPRQHCSVVRPTPIHRHQRHLHTRPRATRKPRDNDDEDLYDVKLDGEDEWPQVGVCLFVRADIPPPPCAQPTAIASSAWRTINGLADGLADVIYQFVPSSVSKTVVRCLLSGACCVLVVVCLLLCACWVVSHTCH